MTSTVLDVTVLLLCVSASVVALGATGSDIGDRGPTADEVADRLVTETVTVTYESSTSPNGTRTVHATRAELLAILIVDSGRESVDSGTSEAFRSRSRAVIGDELGPQTRIDVRTTTARGRNKRANGTGTGTERSGDRFPSGSAASSGLITDTTGTAWLSGNDTETPTWPTTATGTPWGVKLRGEHNDRAERGTGSSTTDEPSSVSVTIGMEPPRNADITTASVTQPAPTEAKTLGSVQIVIRRW